MLKFYFFPPQSESGLFWAYRADCNNNVEEFERWGLACRGWRFQKLVFRLPYSPLAFWRHMHCGKAMLPVKRGSASGRQLRSFSLCLGRLLITNYNNQLPGNLWTWRLPGNGDQEHQIWINLNKVFRDAGFILWPLAFSFLHVVADYPSSSGFGHALPSRGEKDVGGLGMLREFDCRVW